jgi:hypothetical protein
LVLKVTEKGIQLSEEIDECFVEFNKQYTSIWGEDKSHDLAKALYELIEVFKKEKI